MKTLSIRGIGFIVLFLFPLLTQAGESQNFIVTSNTNDPKLEQSIADAADYYRTYWFEVYLEYARERGTPFDRNGKLMNWNKKAPIKVTTGNIGAGGKTTFNFYNGEVYGWEIEISGTPERLIDSVLPHEIHHMAYASLFRRPLNRWADEGSAAYNEHPSERRMLNEIIFRGYLADKSNGIFGSLSLPENSQRKVGLYRLNHLFDQKDYPQDRDRLLLLYGQGHSIVSFLNDLKIADQKKDFMERHQVEERDISEEEREGFKKRAFSEFARFQDIAYANHNNWDLSLKQVYGSDGIQSLSDLESKWRSSLEMQSRARENTPTREIETQPSQQIVKRN